MLLPTITLTGASGGVGSALRPALRGRARVRLVDLTPPADPPMGEETVLVGDLADPTVAERALAGASAVVHLAGCPRGDDWPRLVTDNVELTGHLAETALRFGVRRWIQASSIHVQGAANEPRDWPVPDDGVIRPCCRYGASKAATETVLLSYAERSPGLQVSCLRMPLVGILPREPWERRAWLSTEDLGRAVVAALAGAPRFATHVVTSRCPDPRFDRAAAEEALGHRAVVDAGQVPLADERAQYHANCQLWRPFTTAPSEPKTPAPKETDDRHQGDPRRGPDRADALPH